MSCTSCINSSRMALRRVFLAAPLETSSSSHLRHVLAPSVRATSRPFSTTNHRFFTGIRKITNNNTTPGQSPDPRPHYNPRDPVLHTSVQAPTHDSRAVKAHKPKGGAASALPRDDAIAAVSDYIVLRREDGHLTEPRAVSSVLAEAYIRDQTVVTIVLPRVGQRGGSNLPICVVLDRAAYEESEARRLADEAEKEKGESKKKKGTKELEINWAIAGHDLEHKMKRFKEFLSKGLRVEMLMLKKVKRKGKMFKQASEEEVGETLRKVREACAEVPGAREFKAPSGELGDKYQLFFEGPQK